MKRHTQFIAFSKEHHHALVLALKLKRGQVEGLDWDTQATQLLEHFAAEERQFAALWQPLNQPDLKQRFEAEHRLLRQYLQQMPLDINKAGQLGQLLQAHVRFEERELFPLLECLLDQ